METKLRFYQTLFEAPSDGEICLCYNKFGDFKILVWDESENHFYDEITQDVFSVQCCQLWAYLPTQQCSEFVNKTTITGIK